MTVYEIVQEYHAAWDEAYAHYFAFIALGVGATAFGGLLMSLLKKRVFRWSGATLALVGLCFATYTVFSPYIASGGAIPENTKEIAKQEIMSNYKVTDVQIADSDGYPATSKYFVADLGEGDWADRAHMIVKLKDGRSLEYEVDFDSNHELKLYPVTDTQQVDPETLRREG